MRHMKSLVAVALATAAIQAQIVLPSGFFVASVTSNTSIGVPGALGGIEFSANGSVLYVGGAANTGSGAVYAVPVTRDPLTLHITGLGTATTFASAPGIDGGLAFGPTGTLFFTGYPANVLGEIVGTTTTTFPLPPATGSVGGLAFVPPGFPNAGSLLVSSYNNGDIFRIPLTAGANGTFTPGTETLVAALPSGSEGFRVIPSGGNAGDIIITNYGVGTVAIIDMDPSTGLPVGGVQTPSISTFATGIGGAEGFAFDPLTNDLLISTFNGSPSNSIIRIGGFPAPPFPMTISNGTISAATGGVRTLNFNAGTSNANRGYGIFGGTSGSTPGITVNFVNFPLNYDSFTDLIFPFYGTSLFSNFTGISSATGTGVATMNIPPIPPVAIGVNITFACALIPPFTAASNAVTLHISP